jgi:hypothetical protein
MSDVKKKLLEEINKKADRMKARKQEIANRNNNVEEFVLKMMKEIDEGASVFMNSDLGPTLIAFYVSSLQERMKTLDSNCKTEISWAPKNEDENLPRINGVLIKWSKEYQTVNDCDPELFVDIANLLFT